MQAMAPLESLGPIRSRTLNLAAFVIAVLLRAGSPSAMAADRDESSLFESRVRPVLNWRCVRCHGAAKQESGLRLDSGSLASKGGDRGPAIVPGDPDHSLLIQATRRTGDLKMPPDVSLRPDEVAGLVEWIRQGAKWPVESARTSIRSGPVRPEDRQFWSFQPLGHVRPPDVHDISWPRTPVDRFILARLEAEDLRPAAAADRRTLIRRVTFDLTGLPPSPAEVEAFVADRSPDAFAKVVDRLLASPSYGERWGRHWLDVARYADTAGETADFPVREAYRYRDYVIASFNADKPYDQFLREQIAGDLYAQHAPPERYEELVTATGFIAISRRFGFDPENYQHLDDSGYDRHAGAGDARALAGLRALPRSQVRPGDLGRLLRALRHLRQHARRVSGFGRETSACAILFRRCRHSPANAFRPIARWGGWPRSRATGSRRADNPAPALKQSASSLRGNSIWKMSRTLPGALRSERRRIEKYAHSISRRAEPIGPRGPAAISSKSSAASRFQPKRKGSGRRELAAWITGPSASRWQSRVIANRIWQHHFGYGLVRTENDFGTRGPADPSRAARLSGGPIHRERLVDQSPAPTDPAVADVSAVQRRLTQLRTNAIPQNSCCRTSAVGGSTRNRFATRCLCWAANSTALSAGRIRFRRVETWGFTQHAPVLRRLRYQPTQRLFDDAADRGIRFWLFDGADTNVSTPHRDSTTVPTQALFLLNDPSCTAVVDFCRRSSRAATDDDQRIALASSKRSVAAAAMRTNASSRLSSWRVSRVN